MTIDYENIRLGVGLPSTQTHLPAGFVDSFFCMNRPTKCTYIRPTGGGPIDSIRNEIIDVAIMNKNTHLIMFDTDQVYPENTIEALLTHEKPFVGCKVHRRYPPYDPILSRGGLNDWHSVPDDEWSKGGLVEVDATGFGCVCLDIEAVKKLPRPYFKFDTSIKPPIGEDFYFWLKVKAAGYPIFVDCDIKIGHLSTLMLTEESYFAYKGANSESNYKN